MRICIFGAGAVGSHIAVRLARAGHKVSCVMRGAHLEAARANGLKLRVGDSEVSAKVNASGDPAQLGPQDVVISTLKATALPGLVGSIKPLLRDDTAIVFAQNGIPWWYGIGLPPRHPTPPDISFLDPGGRLRACIPKERIIGGVIFSSNEVIAPGVVHNLTPERNRVLIGECDDRNCERITKLRGIFNDARLESPPVAEIREAIWSKLLTNMSLSVLCLLTGQTARGVRDDQAFAEVIPRMLSEANEIAQHFIPEHFCQRFVIAAARLFQDREGVIAAFDFMQRRPRAERFDHGPEMAEIGKPVTRALQEQHGDCDTGEVLCALARRLLVGMEGKAQEGEPFDTGQRCLRLRLRGHAPAERLSAGDKLQSRTEPRRLLDCRADGGVRDRRLVGTPLLPLHVRKIEAERRDAAAREACCDLLHEGMPHVRAGAVRQHVAGARMVRLRQDRRDRTDALDVELELARLDQD